MIHYFTMEVMAGATCRAGSQCLLFLEHLTSPPFGGPCFHMYMFHPLIVSTRISALVDAFGVVCWRVWTTLW